MSQGRAPRVDADTRAGASGFPWVWGAALLGAAVAIRGAAYWHLPLPFCWWRHLTGIPCPACGCTRSLLAWSQADLVGAFRYNPLFAIGCTGVIAACGLSFLPIVSRRRLVAWSGDLWKKPVFLWTLAGLAALNWIYLGLTLPR